MTDNIILLCNDCGWVFDQINTYIKNTCPRCKKKGLGFIAFTAQDVVDLIEQKKEQDPDWKRSWDIRA